MQEITVRSWAELNEHLYSDTWQEPLQRFRASFVYRGQADADDPLTTSLVRLAGEKAPGIEGPMLRAFRRYSLPYRSLPRQGFWDLLALAQHHGLPTRLLDWTYSPLVALHFATADMNLHDRDGVVWCVDFCKTNERLPAKLRDALNREGTSVFSVELLDSVAETLEAFDGLSRDPFVAFFEPPSLDDRIVNQFALFALLSNPVLSLGEWLAQEGDDIVRRIRVPAKLKLEVRDKLDQANITERVLLPGLDGLSQWLRRYYMPQ